MLPRQSCCMETLFGSVLSVLYFVPLQLAFNNQLSLAESFEQRKLPFDMFIPATEFHTTELNRTEQNRTEQNSYHYDVGSNCFYYY